MIPTKMMGRVQIHRSHGKGKGRSKVPDRFLEVWGKRITKWLKWRYDSFVERSRGGYG